MFHFGTLKQVPKLRFRPCTTQAGAWEELDCLLRPREVAGTTCRSQPRNVATKCMVQERPIPHLSSCARLIPVSIPKLLRLPCRLMRLGIPQLRLRCCRGFRTASSRPPSFLGIPLSSLPPYESTELAESEKCRLSVTGGSYSACLSLPAMAALPRC